jgi:hypothetical protein
VFKSGRPKYAIILFVLSSLWMCATFLPLLYFVVFPNHELQAVVHALEERGTAPLESVAVIQETIAASGPLTRAIPVAYYSGVTTELRVTGSSKTSKKKQASYIASFQKHPTPLLLLITAYEGDGGQRVYAINEGEAMFMVRGYTLPLLLFGVSLFLLRRQKSPASAL